MRGIKLQFSDKAPKLDLTTSVVDSDSTTQNVMVSLGTDKGSDRLFPARGTDLLKSFLQMGYVGDVEAQHIANFAALDSLFFYRSTNDDITLPPLQKIYLVVNPVTLNLIDVAATLIYGPILSTVTASL